MKRLGAIAAVVMILTAACSDSTPDEAKPTTATSPAAVAACTPETAEFGNQAIITDGAFPSSCMKAKADAQFFLINGDDEPHTATTREDSPITFDAHLRQRNSTYSPKLSAGRYELFCTLHGEAFTLFVEAQ